MKNQLVIGGLLALSVVGKSQNSFPNSGNAGIGTGAGAAYQLDIKAIDQDGGIHVFTDPNFNTGSASLYLDNHTSSTGHNFGLRSAPWGDFIFRDLTTLKDRLTITGTTGFVGIGTIAPTQKLDIKDGAVQVVTSQMANNVGGYTFLGRNNTPGPGSNDAYLYHRITPNYHIIGSGSNGVTAKKIGFAVGGSDLESDVKMILDNSGNVGLGTTNIYARMHVAVPNGIGLEIDHNNSTNPYEMAAIIKVNHDLSRPLYVEKSGACIFQIWGTGVVNAKTIYAEALKVTTSAIGQAWPDYVFKKEYKLRSLIELEAFIKENNHLPNVPSAKEVETSGIDVYEINKALLEKVEELSLYVIELNKKVDALEHKNQK